MNKDSLRLKMNRILCFRNKHKTLFYFICYTILFVLMATIVFSWFIVNRKSFIFSGDGVEQHVNSLAYFGSYLRDIIRDLIHNHKLVISMWDMNIGYGSDIITTLHYYVIGDPLCLSAIFVPKAHTELLYTILIIVRFYLSGFSFSCYSLYHKNSDYSTLLGALAFCFSGFSLFAGIRHPYFINPMIYLPIILLGIDKIYKKEKPYVFIIATAIAAGSNFYFFYMICIFMFLYAVFRYIILFRHLSIKKVMSWLFKFIGYFAISVGIACVILLPVIISLFFTKRMGAENYVPLMYDMEYFEGFLTRFISDRSPVNWYGYWNVMGYTFVILLSVFVLFAKKRKYIELKIGFLLLTLFLCIPFIGHILNGFSYVSNRWVWAYSMLNSYILVKMIKEMFFLTKSEKNIIFISLTAYVMLCLISKNARTDNGLGAIILLIATILFLFLFENESSYIRKIGLFLSTCTGVIWCAFSLYSINQNDYMRNYQNKQQWNNLMFKNAPSKIISKIKDTSVFRYDQFGTGESYNTAMQQKLNGTTFYFSLANGIISEYFDEMYLNFSLEQKYNSLDGRTILDTLASVKYYLINDGKEAFLPYNFNINKIETAKIKGTAYSVYQGDNSLPIGYTYTSFIPRDEYLKLSATEKQQALLQGCVLENSEFKQIIPELNDSILNYEMELGTGITMKDNTLTVTKSNSTMTLCFVGLTDSETYLIFENLHVEGIHPNDLYTKTAWDKLSTYTRNKLIEKNKYWTPPESYSITVKSGGVSKSLNTKTNRYSFYSGRHNYLINIGYDKNARTKMVLTFPTVGIYTFDDLKIVCQPMQNVNIYVDALQEDVLEQVMLSANTIEGRIDLDVPKILTISIPYSKGWKIMVDGKERELKQANTMFMAVELESGSHEIKLLYTTPYIKLGLAITIGSCFVFLLLIILSQNNSIHRSKSNSVV